MRQNVLMGKALIFLATILLVFITLTVIIKPVTVEANIDPFTYAIDIGSKGEDYAWGVAETSDGFILAGYSNSYGENSALLIKVRNNNPLGVIEWEEIIGTSLSDERIYDIGMIGNYYVIAGWNKTGAFNSQPILFQVDDNGRLVLSKRIVFSGSISGWFFRVIPETNNTYFLVGYDNHLEIVVLKMNINGSVIWSKSYKRSGDYNWVYGSALDYENRILYLAANDYYAHKTILIAVNSTDGSLLWSKEIGITGSGSYTSMGVSVDNAHNILLYGFNGTWTNNDGFLIKLAPGGTPIWGIVFGTSQFEEPMDAIIFNQSIYLAGYTKMGGIPGNNSFIAKISNDGELLWFKIYGGIGDDWFYRLIVTNNSIIGIGGTNSFTGNDDVLIVQLSPTGEIYNCNLSKTLNSTYINYRAVNITSTDVSITAKSISSSLENYTVNVEKIQMPFKYICPSPPFTIGGSLLPLKISDSNVQFSIITAIIIGTIPPIYMLYRKKSHLKKVSN